MQNDEPTLPQGVGYEPDAATVPSAHSDAPTWPPAGARPPRPLGPDRSPLLWLSLGATGMAVMGLLGILLFNRLGVFTPRGTLGSPGPTSALSGSTSLPSPTATTSPGPLAGGLQVSPSGLRLGCDGDQRTQQVILVNAGPTDVMWQAVVAAAADRAGIAITPNQGALAAGASVSVVLENTTWSSTSDGSSHQEGMISFVPASAPAGAPASLSYRLDLCH
jgi:hypothetical protein